MKKTGKFYLGLGAVGVLFFLAACDKSFTVSGEGGLSNCGTGGTVGASVSVQLGESQQAIPSQYRQCEGPVARDGWTYCVWCDPTNPQAPRFVQVNCTGDFRPINPTPPPANGPGITPPPGGPRIACESDAEVEAIYDEKPDYMEFEVTPGRDVDLPNPGDFPEVFATVSGVPLEFWPSSIAFGGQPITMVGPSDAVMSMALRLGLRSFSGVDARRNMEVHVSFDRDLPIMVVRNTDGKLIDVRPVEYLSPDRR